MTPRQRARLPDALVLGLWLLAVAVALVDLGLQTHKHHNAPPPTAPASAVSGRVDAGPGASGSSDLRLDTTSTRVVHNQAPGRVRVALAVGVVALLAAGFRSKRRVLER